MEISIRMISLNLKVILEFQVHRIIDVEDKDKDAKESESSGSTTNTLQTGTQQSPYATCPYTLRKKIKPPKKYQ